MIDAYDLSFERLKSALLEQGFKPFRAGQVYKWMTKYVPFDEMTDLSLADREFLSKMFAPRPVDIADRLVSADKSMKYIFRLSDGNVIEGALMKQGYGNTICISTQVGCRMGCAFCASGIGGVVRNLTAGEMLAQVLAVNKDLGENADGRNISNIVLMGSGEPLDNYENVTKFIRLMSVSGLIGQRSVSLSTCGLTDGIRRLADDGFSVTLCLSLHSAFDDKRVKIMPTAKKYKLSDIMDAAKYYFEKSGRRIIVEYAMMHGFNTSDADARELRRLTENFPCHINLIPLNDTDSGLRGVGAKEGIMFRKKLEALGASVTIRRSLGDEIEGACGQLKRRYTENEYGSEEK